MKNTIQHSLLAALVLCLFAAFANNARAAAMPMGKPTAPKFDVGGGHLVFCGKTGGKIAKKDFAGKTSLQIEGCPGASETIITSFTLEIVKGGKTTTLQSNSDRLTSDMVAQLKTLSVGDSFEFKKVWARWPNSKDTYQVRTEKFTVG
ncbi:MAG: hypothetical protein IPN76_18240 [Saprospiraceae bacterium]|nr:hypothetical protein [Saprospiraceae bacterium]